MFWILGEKMGTGRGPSENDPNERKMRLRVWFIEEHINRDDTIFENNQERTPQYFEGIEDLSRWLCDKKYYPEGANTYYQHAKGTESGGAIRKGVIIEGMDESTYLNLWECVRGNYYKTDIKNSSTPRSVLNDSVRTSLQNSMLHKKSIDTIIEIKVAQGAILGAPIYEINKGKRNWMAIITENEDAPGHFGRRFLEHGERKCYYVINALKVGDPIEFGADWEDPENENKQRVRRRWYGVVKAITIDKLTLIRTSGPEEAFSYSVRIKAEMEKPINRLARLETSKQVLKETLIQVDSEIEALMKLTVRQNRLRMSQRALKDALERVDSEIKMMKEEIKKEG